MAKKTDRQKIIEKLDEIVSKIVVLRDGECVTCGSVARPGKGHGIGAGHIFSRQAFSTRWDILPDGNVHAQCWACNFRHVHDQYPYFNWYIKKFGQDKFDELRRKFKTIVHYKTFELEEIYKALKEVYDQLYANRCSRS